MASTFTVNGTSVTVENKQVLLRYLRDTLHITSAKDGCSEGACGACTVLIDGIPVKSCVPDTDSLNGRHVLTVEGLSEWEKEVYSFAFAEAGAVQCGFCIPGMTLCAKSLLDKNPAPTEPEIRYAIRNNYCRCTGYAKIIAAIRLAGRILRTGIIPDKKTESWKVGSPVQRLDAKEKVLGFGKYADDYYPEGMLYGSALLSKYPRARVLNIDTTEAKKLPGVKCVLTAEDIPGENIIGHVQHDQYTLVPTGELTHYLGDPIALVAAVDRATAEKAKKLIKVEYEVLPAVHNIEEAASPHAPLVFENTTDNIQSYKHISRGNAEKAIQQSAYVLSEHFETPWTEHAFLEPECAVAFIDDDNDVFIFSTDQSAHQTLLECCTVLKTDKVKVQNALVGGGFGGKEDLTVQHHAALLTYVTRCPVKVKLSRADSLLMHPKRHHFEMDFTMGCDKDGIIQGVKATVKTDTGAYASLGGPVLERACTHAAGPYHYNNFEIEGTSYYTNNPPAGAFRGFGVTQTCFATESLLNRMADLVGISPLEIRYRNAIRPGEVLPNGQIVDASTGLVETLDQIRPYYEAAIRQGKPAGIACAMKNAGVGVGLPDFGRVNLIVEQDEKVHIYTGASCIGQGLGTVLVQIAVETTGLSRDDIVYERSNTWNAPDSGVTSGSRQTLVTGEALRRACEKLHDDLLTGASLKDLCNRSYYGEFLAKTDFLGSDKPNPVSHIAYGYATHLCVLDPSTGKIDRMVAAHDVGKAINPLSCEGQIEGGVVMSLGYALRENFPFDGNCKPTAKFGTLGLFRAHEIPPITPIIVDKPGFNEAYGAIGIGEITSIPTAPAIADAYYRLDGIKRTTLPLQGTPYAKHDSDNCDAGHAPTPGEYRIQCVEGCVGCGLCAKNCPAGAINVIDKKAKIDYTLCLGCGKCVVSCPKRAVIDTTGIIKR